MPCMIIGVPSAHIVLDVAERSELCFLGPADAVVAVAAKTRTARAKVTIPDNRALIRRKISTSGGARQSRRPRERAGHADRAEEGETPGLALIMNHRAGRERRQTDARSDGNATLLFPPHRQYDHPRSGRRNVPDRRTRQRDCGPNSTRSRKK